ncbi:MAG TPA: alpha/beta hydrolase-fold protein [Pirellulales bacterium]|nr:alpha/beta hydrolase-fold protein [Pirellulales bacterium]
MSRITLAVMIAAVAGPSCLSVAYGEPVTVNVTLDTRIADHPLSGRLFVYFSRKPAGEPRFGPDWFSPEPFYAIDVTNFKPGLTRVVDDRADGFPDRISALPPGNYRVQALLDQATDTHQSAYAGGNVYSDVRDWRVDPQTSPSVDLVLSRVVPPRQFAETAWLKEVSLESKLLTEFHERPIAHRAAVVLPQTYQRETARRYPVLYIVPGFGGTHYDAIKLYPDGAPPAEPGEVEFIRVLLSGDCRWGHHVFADSATNGPRGEALVKEIIPYIDAHFRTVAAPSARFITGHSSGGWSSLWVQVNAPDVFGGVWSTAPDPVDFHDWQQVDLYASPPLSLYYDEARERRPIARRGTQPILWYASFAKMDDVLARGGQLRSFEAVFSPLDEKGLPKRLWDRESGTVDPDVVQAWSKYDICRLLEQNWLALEPRLRGKLHVYTGELDTFYLDGAVRRLAETLKQLGADAEVYVVPGKNHSDLLTKDLRHKIMRQMSAVYLTAHGPAERPAAKPAPGKKVGVRNRRMPARNR